MIPQRIAVKGFLCYREEQEISFDSSSLWMLSGPNGSGKSSMFDAMTYALFGHHRAGQKNARELINKHSAGLEVEFDFLLDGQVYQARRTLRQQSNRSTRQLRQYHPAIVPGVEGRWEEVAGTDNEEGFAAWVRDHVGLTYETFTSSVLMLQGKAEKLLDADPKERRRVLANLVGLHRYEKLFDRADARRKELLTEVRVLQHQLEGLPTVSRADLRKAKQDVQAAEAAWEAAGVEVERLRSLSLALPWLSRLHRERESLRQAGLHLADAVKGEQTAAAELRQAEAERALLLERGPPLAAARQDADRGVTRTVTLGEETEKRLTRFEDAAGGAACSFCGQPLSPVHVDAEKARLRAELETAAQEHQQAVQAQKRAADAEAQLAGLLADNGRRLRTAGEQVEKWQRQQEDAERERQRALRECDQAYRAVAEPYRSRISRDSPANWLITVFPTESDLEELQGSATELDADQVQRQLEAAQREQIVCADKLQQARQDRDRLLDRQAQRGALQKKYLAVGRRHNHYHLLAELLGPRRLQLYLVRQAERGIIVYTNAVLDRLSGGQLYLRLRGEEESEAGPDRALDLEAYDRAAAGQTPFDVRFLSGSQRFRVAVSLALGIGQYASRQHRPIESVIIDEGFGCLDREGRQAMIQELQNLRGQLRCILLVSHQEEFADAFGDGYRFERRGGSTRVARLQR
jgi:DNA repair exonuclease SbcCD ATPase subunit